MEVAIGNALQKGAAVLVPSAALAQVWRGSPRQARLAQMFAASGVEVVPLDGLQARLAGVLCGRQKHDDIVGGSVAVVARRFKSLVLSSDPNTSGSSIPHWPSRRYERKYARPKALREDREERSGEHGGPAGEPKRPARG